MNELSEVVKELAEIYRAGGVKTTRFSITLSERDNGRLEKYSDDLQISKQELVSRLLIAALNDFEREIQRQQKGLFDDLDLIDIDPDDLILSDES